MEIIQILNNLTTNSTITKNTFSANEINGIIFYQKNSVDLISFNKTFKKMITSENIESLSLLFPGIFEKAIVKEVSEFTSKIYTGNIILYINENIIYFVSLPNISERSPSESVLDPVNPFGSRDGLIENIQKNISLIQRKLKLNNLKNEEFTLGKRTNTKVSVLYINDIASKRNVKEVTKKLSSLNMSSIININTINNLFTKNSLFPLTGESGSTEFICESLLKGKIAILIDQIPVAILLPVTIDYFTKTSEASSLPTIPSFFKATLTYLLFFLSIFFLGLYVAIVNYHSNNLSLLIISEIKITARGTTIPLAIEIIFILILFDILKMSNTKTPSTSIQNVVVIVGGILIGQNTINSGFIGAFNLVITAICYLSTFGVTTNQNLIISFSILRVLLLISSIILGLFGFILTTILITIYISNLKSLSADFLSPFSPQSFHDILLSFLPKEAMRIKKRPESLNTIDKDYGK